MLTMTIVIIAWIGAGMVAALAIGRASTIGCEPASSGMSPRDPS